jgi:hypothetical protein
MKTRSGWVTAGIVIGVIIIIAVISAIVGSPAGSTSKSEADSAQARQLARQLNTALNSAGLPVVSTSTATRLFGTDGGISCKSAGHLANTLGFSQLGNASLNQRRIPLNPSVIAFDKAVISTYCPDRLAAYESKVNSITQAQTIQQ